jgi:hypothetical protein
VLFLTEDNGGKWREITPAGMIGATNGEGTHRPLRRAPDENFYLAGYKQDGSGGGLLQSADGRTWSVVPNTPHSSVTGGAIAFDSQHVFLGDRDSMAYRDAQFTALDQWTTIPTPDGLAPINGNGEGSSYLEYDEEHRVLYSSNMEGGLWRLVMPSSFP